MDPMDSLLRDIEDYRQASFDGDAAGMESLAHVRPYMQAMADYSQASFDYDYERMAQNAWVLPVMEAAHRADD